MLISIDINIYLFLNRQYTDYIRHISNQLLTKIYLGRNLLIKCLIDVSVALNGFL